MKTPNLYLPVLMSVALLSGAAADAAILFNGDLGTAPPSAYSNSSGNVAYYLDEVTGNILDGTNVNPYNGTTDTGIDVNQWFQTTLNGIPVYNATGGNGGGGGMVMVAPGNLDNKPRAVLQFAQDDKATKGTISVTIDLKFSSITSGMVANIELYAWNAGDAGSKLSQGGGGGNTAVFNVTELGDATNLLGGTGMAIAGTDANGFAADTWKTVTVDSSVDLETGYDFYAWRVGFYGADGPNDVASFDNLTVVPEPGSFALLGTGLLFLVARRRR